MLDCCDCSMLKCHCLMLKYKLHHWKRTKADHAKTATRLDQATLWKSCKMSPVPQAMGMDVITAAAAVFNSKANQDCDCRSNLRQKGRRAQLPRNIKATGTISS